LDRLSERAAYGAARDCDQREVMAPVTGIPGAGFPPNLGRSPLWEIPYRVVLSQLIQIQTTGGRVAAVWSF